MDITVVLLWILAVVGLVTYLVHKWRYWNLRAIPGIEPCYPLLGNALIFAKASGYWKSFRNDNRMTKIWFGPVPVINVQHPDLVQKVLSECLDKPFAYDYMELGRGLISERYGNVWREHRKTLSPLFNTRILYSFMPIFERATGSIVGRLAEVADGRDVDLLEYTRVCSAEVVHGTMVTFERLPEELVRKLIESLDVILEALGTRIRTALYALKTFYKMSAMYREEWRSRKLCYATKMRANIINERNELLVPERSNDYDDDDEDGGANAQKPAQSIAFVERLLTIQHKGRPFTDEEIANHAYTMLVAGYETSALQLSTTCLMLAMHPDVQERVVSEIQAVLPTADSPITPETLRELIYLDQTLNEVLRLYPVAPLIARQSTAPLELDGVLVPAGMVFTVNIACVHRRTDVWGANAVDFDPDNFSPERAAGRHPYAYIPFSGGPRVCIGNRYSMISMKVFLIRFLQQFRLNTRLVRKELKFKFQVTQKLITPYTVQLEKRNLYGSTE
uniref:Uncharacterized protein n=1 Tax=Culex quinquefasciatus TaxID=7176 RepID=A0A1S4K3X5_CULQU